MEMAATQPVWPGWETVKVIGAGSFGTVYEIQRNVNGMTQRAALKLICVPRDPGEIDELINEGYDDNSITAHFKECLEDIIREYSMMLQIKGHSNVVYCEDIRKVPHPDGIGWDILIKMELLTPLTKGLDKTYDETQALRLGIDLCRALELCRQKNILHRDIKPQNVFISPEGDFKLGDFGVAKVSDKTSGGTKIGTYDYMAPEIYNNRPYGASSDLYAVGMVLYWVMNERRGPFLPLPPQIPTGSAKDSANQRRFSGEALPSPANGSQELQQIVLKACAFDSTQRYSSPAQLHRALSELMIRQYPQLPRKPLVGDQVICLPKPSEIQSELLVSLSEAATGIQKELTLTRQELCAVCSGKEAVCPACQSMGYKTVPRTLKLAVPAGIGDQQLLRIPGQGNMGGDLMVKVSIEPNKWFVRKELDVYSSVAVSGQTMEYGGLIRILTVHGPVDFQLPKGTRSGQQFKITGYGMPQLQALQTKGDHYFTVIERKEN